MPSRPESPDDRPATSSRPSPATPSPSRPKALITLDEAADRLSISVRQVYRLVNRNHLKVVHVGRSARIVEHTLDDYIDSLTRSPFA